jgi:hypothetical protein
MEPCVLQAAHRLMDFVYLAQYHSHTDDTLTTLQRALDDFHRSKDVFIELGCRDQFNIPKLHSLIHYTDIIRNLGSLDGLNTETSKRLHIDFAKKAYTATSRRDYTVQMTRWLQWQEAVIWFSNYLAWHDRTRLVDTDSPLSTDSEHERPIQGVEHRSVTALQHCQISQQPQFPKRTIQYLEEHHRAACFLDALKAFVNTLPHSKHHFFEPNANDRFDIFSNFILFMPPIEHATSKHSRIHSHPQCYNGIHKPPTLTRYDTVLVEVDTALRGCGGLHGRSFSLSN